MWIVAIIILIIAAVISICIDESKKSGLTKQLNAKGFNITAKLDIPDITKDNQPFCFLYDKDNKKWFLANYREKNAEAYDFEDIVDYKMEYRLRGTAVLKGSDFSGKYSEFKADGAKIFDVVDLDKKNCEYISFELDYQGKAKEDGVCNKFVLFESQEGEFTNAKHHDFVVPSMCIDNAKDFEEALFNILSAKEHVDVLQ